MDSFLEGMATSSVANKLDFLCSRGFMTTYAVSLTDIQDEFNVACCIKMMTTSHHGEVEIVRLQLSNVVTESLDARQPRATGETMRFDSTAYMGKVQVGEVYILAGAKVKTDLEGSMPGVPSYPRKQGHDPPANPDGCCGNYG